MEKNIIDLPDLEQKIYRLFSKEIFLKILQNKRLRLVRPSVWEDPFEDAFFKNDIINNHGEAINQSYERDRLYGLCWTLKYESDALWRIYSDKKLLDGIKVQTTIRKLFSRFYNSQSHLQENRFFIGRIEYLTADEIKTKVEDEKFSHDVNFDSTCISKAKTLLFKRKEFDHEQEVRLIYYERQLHEVGKYPEFYEFDFEPNELFEKIELDPRMNSSNFQNLQIELKKYYQGEISRSTLYDMPVIQPRMNIGSKSFRELNEIIKRKLEKEKKE